MNMLINIFYSNSIYPKSKWEPNMPSWEHSNLPLVLQKYPVEIWIYFAQLGLSFWGKTKIQDQSLCQKMWAMKTDVSIDFSGRSFGKVILETQLCKKKIKIIRKSCWKKKSCSSDS